MREFLSRPFGSDDHLEVALEELPVDDTTLQAELRRDIDHTFPTLDALLDGSSSSSHAQAHAGPSQTLALKRVDSRRSGRDKRKRTLEEEIGYWEAKEAAAQKELEATKSTLPELLRASQEKLQRLLESAQSLSIERYALADKLANLITELDSSQAPTDDGLGENEEQGGSRTSTSKRGSTVLEQMEALSEELKRLEAGLVWVKILEQVVLLSERILSPRSHHPSPLAAIPSFRQLQQLVEKLQESLPSDMSLLQVIKSVRDSTWLALKDIMSQELLHALTPLKWPLKVDYPVIPAQQRRTFERAFQDLLYLQAEGESMGVSGSTGAMGDWTSGDGLYPLQVIVQPISLRFKYHFQGSRNTNRVDKPEWAFSNILDQIYEQQSFLEEYIQPLASRAGYADVDVKSEFTMLLFPTLLAMLRSRIPRLLDHPALLAHTIYQTVVFDDSVREGGFDIDSVSVRTGLSDTTWEGLAGVLLKDEGWFNQWLAGEKKFADGQLNEVISSSDAWNISDETTVEDGSAVASGSKPTVSSRQIKSLFEQITDRYSPLPSLEYRLPFLTNIQLPILMTYHSRISGSLDAFETLSSAFVRAVPGALSGNTRGGVHVEPSKVTGGTAGLDRLIRAYLSASWLRSAIGGWADEIMFVEMSAELKNAVHLRWRLQGDNLLPNEFKSAAALSRVGVSVFDSVWEKFDALKRRTEDMIVRHVTVEVQNELREHLKRRWDQSSDEDEQAPDSSLVNALSTYSSQLATLSSALPAIIISRLYRRIVSQFSNHISQRAVYSGWSKFTCHGGRDFMNEIKDWIQTSSTALSLSSSAASELDVELLNDVSIGIPWRTLLDAGRLLSLPSDSSGFEDGDKAKDMPTFSQAMAAAWSEGEESLRAFCERCGVEHVSREELQAILRRRVECWR